jgi:hypothetical protein
MAPSVVAAGTASNSSAIAIDRRGANFGAQTAAKNRQRNQNVGKQTCSSRAGIKKTEAVGRCARQICSPKTRSER